MTEPKGSIEPSQELAIRTDHDAKYVQLEALTNNISVACESLLRANKLPYHSIKARVKAPSSTLEKIVRKGYEPFLSKVEDLVGIRVICFYPRHVDPIVALLEHEFKILEKIDKRPAPGTTQFGYSSVHLICTVENTPRASLPEYIELKDFPFEIQVRTILQEAWAEIEHGLIYKTGIAAPEEIKHQIARVSAVLEMADEDFQRVYDLRQAYAEKLKEADIPLLGDEPLNVDSLLEVIRRRYAWAEGWEEEVGDKMGPYLAMLLSEMQALGVTTVRQLMALIDKWHDQVYQESHRGYLVATRQIEPEKPDDTTYSRITESDPSRAWHNRTKQYFMPIGHIRGIFDNEFPDYRKRRHGQP